MGIPNKFDPMGCLGGGESWPDTLRDGLLDGWLARSPSRTAKGAAVLLPTRETSNTAFSYKFVTEPAWSPKTLLFCSTANIRTQQLYNPPQFAKGGGEAPWGVFFYGISNLPPGDPLDASLGVIIDTPRRYRNANFRVAAPFAAAVTHSGAQWRVFNTVQGWAGVPLDYNSYATPTQWRFCAAWAAYDSVLSDGEVELRLGILRQFANS